MILGALEITYSAIRLNHPSRDLVPWTSVFMPLAAVFSAISMLVVPASWGLDSALTWPVTFKYLSPQVAITFGLAVVVVWFAFDNRRAELAKKYDYLRKLDSTGESIVLCAAVWTAGFGLLALSRRQPAICLIVFCALCVVPHLLVRKPK